VAARYRVRARACIAEIAAVQIGHIYLTLRAREFLEEVERGLIQIQLFPHRFPLGHREARRILLHRFPYGIYFIATEDAISVVAVYHGSRNPKRWQDRLNP
jgi:plasmid stabilization system protein ParE